MKLKHVLWVKIVFTLLGWCLPLLTFPAPWFQALGMPEPRPLVFARLLGAAFLALLVGYLFGLHALKHGRPVRQTVWVGIVSNGSASLILFAFGLTGAWGDWGGVARAVMWLSAALTGGITVGLAMTGLADAQAVHK
jgi:hypothetical protein